MPGPGCGGPHQSGGDLNGEHVLGLRAFLPADFGEADGLPFGQGLKTLADNRTEMHEQVGTVTALNEAEAFAFVKRKTAFAGLCNCQSRNRECPSGRNYFRLREKDTRGRFCWDMAGAMVFSSFPPVAELHVAGVNPTGRTCRLRVG